MSLSLSPLLGGHLYTMLADSNSWFFIVPGNCEPGCLEPQKLMVCVSANVDEEADCSMPAAKRGRRPLMPPPTNKFDVDDILDSGSV